MCSWLLHCNFPSAFTERQKGEEPKQEEEEEMCPRIIAETIFITMETAP